MLDERVDVVDKHDVVLKTITRSQATNNDILRAAVVFVENATAEILLQLRSKKSKRYPLHWDCTGGGHVSSGESYASAAKRELFEEVGLTVKLEFLETVYFELDDGRKFLNAFFKGFSECAPVIDPIEVEAVRAFSRAELKEMIAAGEKFHPECLYGLRKYFL